MIVVTGATGHIGNVLTRELCRQGRRVRAVLPPGEDRTPLDGLDLEYAIGDVRDAAFVRSALAGAEIVFHLAGIVSISAGKRALIDGVNVGGTRNVVRACLDNGVGRLVYTSSVHALPEPPRGRAVDEGLPVDPRLVRGVYGKSKAAATREVLAGIQEGLEAVIVFPTGVIGPFDYKQSEMGQLIVDFARQRLPAYVAGGYDFVDVRDVAAGLISASQQGRPGQGYLLGGEWISVRDLLLILQELTGVPAPAFLMPRWLAMAAAAFSPAYYAIARTKPRFTSYSIYVLGANAAMNITKARRELAYAPRPIRESLRDSVAWFKEQGRI